MLLAIFFKLSMLLSVQLIALTGAIILCIYVKKQDAGKWYSYLANAIMGVVVLMMLATFIGSICMACCRHHEEEGERRMFIHKEMRYHERDRDDECEREGENCRRGSMNCCKEDRDEENSCSGSEDEEKVVIKDTVIEHKPLKK
jgi:hypothetical protein